MDDTFAFSSPVPIATSTTPANENTAPGIASTTCPPAMTMPPYSTDRRAPIIRSASQRPTIMSR